MTQWQEQPLRKPGLPWPGLNTRGGRLDDGSGQLEDGSINCQINRADTLSKRSGMVRGLDEWFGSVVCGLFTYQDYCGQQYLLVADEEGINIRQPFVLPQFLASDAYPNDTFDGDGAINVTNWRNTDRYVRSGDNMAQAVGAPLLEGPRLAAGTFMRWFKDAGAFAYEVRIDYVFDPALTGDQRIGVVLRGNGDLSTGALLQLDAVFNEADTYELQMFYRDGSGEYRTLLTEEIDGIRTAPSGTLTFRYERNAQNEFEPVATILANQGAFATHRAATLTAVEDADLGLVSALALGQKQGGRSPVIGVQFVAGGPI